VIALRPSDLLASVYLSINKICPDFVGLELGIGESLLIKGNEKGKIMEICV